MDKEDVMDLEITILSEVSQKEKDKYHMISLAWNLKYETKELTKQEQIHRLRKQTYGYWKLVNSLHATTPIDVTRVYVPRFFVSSQQRFGVMDIKAPSPSHGSQVLDRPCYSSQVSNGPCYSS